MTVYSRRVYSVMGGMIYGDAILQNKELRGMVPVAGTIGYGIRQVSMGLDDYHVYFVVDAGGDLMKDMCAYAAGAAVFQQNDRTGN